jgi:23S rRNA (adenine2503-C2)-methyltransferase
MHYLDPADEPDSEPEQAIPAGRHTVCLSTQAGCAMGCVFCATGQMGLLRDLDAAECIEQVVYCARRLRAAGEKLDNVVFMGMGEPLANWPATWATIQRLVDPEGLALSPRRLTISTVGIVPGIRKLAEVGLPLRLAVSLHAPDDALRSRLVAVNSVYGLDAILDACRAYQAAGGRRITFEYVLIHEVNDSPEQALALARRISGVNAHCNLIPLNPTEGSQLEPSSPARAEAFQAMLRNCGVMATLRMRRGIDVAAGCGQLRARDGAGLLGRTIPIRELSGGGPS